MTIITLMILEQCGRFGSSTLTL